MFRSKSLLKCSQAIINQQLGNKTSGTSLNKSNNSFDGHVSNRIENLIHPLKDNALRRTNSEINSTKTLKKTKSCNFLSQINNLNKTLGNHKVSSSCCTLQDYNTYPYLESKLCTRITNETKIVYKDRNFNIELNKKYSVYRSNKYESNKKNSFKYTSCNKLRIAHIQQKQKFNYSRKIKTGPTKKRIQHGQIQIQAYKLCSYIKNINEQVNVDTIFSYNRISNTICKKKEQNKKVLESRTDIYLPQINIRTNNVLDVDKTPIEISERKAQYIQNGSINKIFNNTIHSPGARAAIALNVEFINRKISILPKYQSYNTITTTCNNTTNTLKKKEIKTINSISNEKQYSLDGEGDVKVRSVMGEDKFSKISQDDSVQLNNSQESDQISTTNIKDLAFNNTILLPSGKDLEMNESKKECILTSIYTTPTVVNYDKFSSEITHDGFIESNLSKERALLSIYSGNNKCITYNNTKVRKSQSKLCKVENNNTGTNTTKYEKQMENKFKKDVKMGSTYLPVNTRNDSKHYSKTLKGNSSITNQNNEEQTDKKLYDDLLQSDKKPVKPEAVAWKIGRNYQQLKSKIYYNFDKVINADNAVINKNEMESVPWIKGKHYEQIKETKKFINFKQKNENNKKGNVENDTGEVGWIKGQNIGEVGKSLKKTCKLNYHPNQKENGQMIFSFPINYLKGVRVTNSDTFGFTNCENCGNITSATPWMRNKYSKSENNLFNHFHEIKSTAPNNKNYSQAACETNITTKKSKYKQINNKDDLKKDKKTEATWEQSTFRVDEEKPIIDLHVKKLPKLEETNNTDTKLDLIKSKKTNVNERYQHIESSSKNKNISTAVPWVRNQNTFMNDDIRSEIFDKVGLGKQNWIPNLSLIKNSTKRNKKEEKTDQSHLHSENKINCSLSHHKQTSKPEKAPVVSSTFKETKINPNGNNETVTKRGTGNKLITTNDTIYDPITQENKISMLNNCNETRNNNAETKSQLLVIWKKDDKIQNEKDIADLTKSINVRPLTNTNEQFLSSNKSKSNTLSKVTHTGVAWVRSECITNKDKNYFHCSDNFTKSSKHLHQQKKVERNMSADALKNCNDIKMNENNTAVAWEQKLINDQNSFQSIYKSGESEKKIREGKKLPETNDNIKEIGITANSESEIPLDSETKNTHVNDMHKSVTKKNSQILKETITNITKNSLDNNLITQQNLKDSPGKLEPTTMPKIDSTSKSKIKISLANASRNYDQIKGEKMTIHPDCGIIKLQKQNDQFKKMLTFPSKNQKEGKIKAAYPTDPEEELKRDKNEKIQANNMKGIDDQKKVGTEEVLHKNKLDKAKAFNFKQTQIDDTKNGNNTYIESETKKKLKLPLEKKETSKNDIVKKQNTGETKNDDEFAEYIMQLTDNKTHGQRMHEFYEFEEKLLGFKKPQTNVYLLDETSQTTEPEIALKKNIVLQSFVNSQCNNKRTVSSSKLFQNNITENKFTRGKSNSTTTDEQKLAEENKDTNTHDREKLKVLRNVKPSIRNEQIPNKLCTDKSSESLNTIQVNEIPIKDSNTLISTLNNDKNMCTPITIGDESTKLTKILTDDGSVHYTKTNIKPENNDFIKKSHYMENQTGKKMNVSEKIAATKIRNRLIQTNSAGQSIIVNEKNYNEQTTETIACLETTPVKAENLVHLTITQANKDVKKTDDNTKYETNPKILRKIKNQKYNRTTKNSDMEQADTKFMRSRSEILDKEATKLLKNVEKISDQENVSLNVNMLKETYDSGMKELYKGPMETNLNERNKRQKDSISQSTFYSDCTKILQNDSMTVYAPNKSISAESILMSNEQNKAEAPQGNMSSSILKTMLKAVVYTVFNNRNPHDQLIESEMINSKESDTIKRKEEEEKEGSKKCNSENELSPWLSNDEANDVEDEHDNENQFLMPINDTRFPMINENKIMFEYPKSPMVKIINYNDEMVYKHVPSVSKVLNGTLPISTKKELENWEINHLTTLGKTKFKEYYRGQIKNDIQFHDCIRRHILGTPMNILTENANVRLKGCLSSLKGILPKLKNVTVLESPVVHPVLPYHGIVDCVACYNNNPVLIEWKQADRLRPIKELMYDVPVQLAAYIGAINHDQHYKIPIKSGIIVVAYTDGSPADVLTLTKKQLEDNWKIWLERLESYMASK